VKSDYPPDPLPKCEDISFPTKEGTDRNGKPISHTPVQWCILFQGTPLAILNGWSITNTMQGGGTVIMTAEKDGRTLSVAIAEAEGQTSITIGVEAAK
jgi:hypothetical protein